MLAQATIESRGTSEAKGATQRATGILASSIRRISRHRSPPQGRRQPSAPSVEATVDSLPSQADGKITEAGVVAVSKVLAAMIRPTGEGDIGRKAQTLHRRLGRKTRRAR